MPERIKMLAPTHILHDPPCLLAAIRDLYSHRPESFFLEPWEMQSLLWSLGYCEDLAPEAEIAAAVEVARGDYDPDAAA